jgi:hypothetical protein
MKKKNLMQWKGSKAKVMTGTGHKRRPMAFGAGRGGSCRM